ncbi:MAG: DUF542 domain-containing protein [Deltaproteobacteria bacterium]|nr:DUF542 domain-containing protein [Deltaproteobacteria bacterium]
MSDSFTASTTIDEVLHVNAALSRILNARGIDTCCGGSATLAEATEIRGLGLAELLAELNAAAPAAAVAEQPPGEAPAAVRSCTPPVPEEAALAATPSGVTQPVPTPKPAQFVPFFIASLLIALTFGATLGMLTLATMTLPWSFIGAVPVGMAKIAHGYSQVFGFATLFIMGVAYHIMPRFTGNPVATVGLAKASFWLQTGGVVLIAAGMLIGAPVAAPARVLGSLLLLAAATAFGSTVHRTLAGGTPTPEHLERYLRAGCVWLLLASALACITAAGVEVLQPAVWETALWGFAASWIFGMSLRVLPVFLGLPPAPGRYSAWLFAGYQAAAALWITVSVAEAWYLIPLARALAGSVLGVAAATFVALIGIFGPRLERRGRSEQGYEKFMVSAYAWLLVALFFAPGWSAAAALRGGAAPSLLLDFGRHAFTLGFLTQIIFGVSTRIIPVFTGAPLWNPAWHTTTYFLLNAAVLARGLEVAVELAGWSEAWPYISISGPLAVGAFAAFSANVMLTVRSRPPVAAVSGGDPVADALVVDLLQVPGALDLLVSRGFRPLQNPAMRAAMGRTLTLRQACRIHGIDVTPLAAELRRLAAQRS